MEMGGEELLKAVKIKKDFAGVYALKGVDFILHRGEGLALVGENGAGKSTLMKIISGVYPRDEYTGHIFLEGKQKSFFGTHDAEEMGISIIHQELNLFPQLSIAENIFLSHLPCKRFGIIDHAEIYAKTKKLLNLLGLNFSPETKVSSLTTGHQQMVEVAKALSRNAKILILDEPTSSLTTQEVANLFKVIKSLQAKSGLSFIYISHKLDEVFELCQRGVILRDGKSVYENELSQINQKTIIAHMVGRELSALYPSIKVNNTKKEQRDIAFEVKNWSAYKFSEGKYRVKKVSFKAYGGEILGISGLMGAGRTDLLLSLFGHHNYRGTGEIFLSGQKIQFHSPTGAIAAGLGLVTEDRKLYGLHLNFAIRDNMTMATVSKMTERGLLDQVKMENKTKQLIKKLNIKMGRSTHPVKTLSGGNQQKVAIGKWLATSPKVLFLDEPTRGIDVGAKFEIYTLLNQLVEEEVCVIIASSELPEIMGLCNRVIVMNEGCFAETFEADNINETDIMKAAIANMGEQRRKVVGANGIY